MYVEMDESRGNVLMHPCTVCIEICNVAHVRKPMFVRIFCFVKVCHVNVMSRAQGHVCLHGCTACKSWVMSLPYIEYVAYGTHVSMHESL